MTGGVRFTAAEPDTVAELSRALVESGALIVSMAPESATLEDLFFSLTEGSANGVDPRAQGALVEERA